MHLFNLVDSLDELGELVNRLLELLESVVDRCYVWGFQAVLRFLEFLLVCEVLSEEDAGELLQLIELWVVEVL